MAQLFPISAAEFSRYSGIKVVKPSVTVTHTIIQYIPPVLEENRFSALSNVCAQALKFTLIEANQGNQEVSSELLRPWPEIMEVLAKIFLCPRASPLCNAIHAPRTAVT